MSVLARLAVASLSAVFALSCAPQLRARNRAQSGTQSGAQLRTQLRTQGAPVIPSIQAVALDGHTVTLPRDLPGRATVLILGFGRRSAGATTAWEKPVRAQLAHLPAVSFYDMAIIAEVPGFARPFVLRAIRKQVPDVLKPNFLPLTDHEDAWKQVASYLPDQAEAAYVLLVDTSGRVRWSTHAAFTPEAFAKLSEAAQQLANAPQ